MKNFKAIIFGVFLALAGMTAHAMDDDRLTLDTLPGVLPDTTRVVLRYDNEIVGRITYCDKPNSLRRILTFTIKDGLTGQGLGTKLMAYFIEQSKNNGITHIDVVSTQRAVSIYQRFGFQQQAQTLYMTKIFENITQ